MRLWTSTSTVVKFERRNLGLLRVFLLTLACATDERKPIALRLLGCEAVAFAVLPDAAPVTGNAVGAIVHVLAVFATDRAVEVPVTIVFRKLLEFFLVLFLLGLALAF